MHCGAPVRRDTSNCSPVGTGAHISRMMMGESAGYGPGWAARRSRVPFPSSGLCHVLMIRELIWPPLIYPLVTDLLPWHVGVRMGDRELRSPSSAHAGHGEERPPPGMDLGTRLKTHAGGCRRRLVVEIRSTETFAPKTGRRCRRGAMRNALRAVRPVSATLFVEPPFPNHLWLQNLHRIG